MLELVGAKCDCFGWEEWRRSVPVETEGWCDYFGQGGLERLTLREVEEKCYFLERLDLH